MSPAALNCDQGGIQTLDLQNRNLTLYSLSYPANYSAKVYIILTQTKSYDQRVQTKRYFPNLRIICYFVLYICLKYVKMQ